MRIGMILAIAVFMLVFIPASQAALNQWDIIVLLNEDKTTEWTVDLSYNETVTKTDYFILGKVSDYEVLADNKPVECSITYDIGSTILCSISAKHIVYKIRTAVMISDVQKNFKVFAYKFSVTSSSGKFGVTIKLPLGSALVESENLGNLLRPYAPEYGIQGSDGRRIFVNWVLDKPVLGDTIDTFVIYEQISEKAEIPLFTVIIAGIVIIFLAFLFYIRRRHVMEILPILTLSERKVVEILLREKGDVDQRQIVKETDFSKTTVSRLISNLVRRGVIEKTAKGRKNLIRLKKSIKRKDMVEMKEPKKEA